MKDELIEDGDSRSPEYESESFYSTYRFGSSRIARNRPYFKIQQHSSGFGTNFTPANQFIKNGSASPINLRENVKCVLLNSTKKSNLSTRKTTNNQRGAITLNNNSLKISNF